MLIVVFVLSFIWNWKLRQQFQLQVDEEQYQNIMRDKD